MNTSFASVVDEVRELSVEERRELIDVLEQSLVDERRDEIFDNGERSKHAFRNGGLKVYSTKEVPITVDREIMCGEPVFIGTRVPVTALIDNLEVGVSLDEFLENFPSVKREHAVNVLEHFKATLNDISLAA